MDGAHLSSEEKKIVELISLDLGFSDRKKPKIKLNADAKPFGSHTEF